MTLEDLVRLRRARDRMDREYAEPLDVAALARTALMSPGHFQRSFRAAYGETPLYSYLMTRRIERAEALLRRGDLTVTEVCLAVGCTSLGSFSSRLAGAGRRDPERIPGPAARPRRPDPAVRGPAPDPPDPPPQPGSGTGYTALGPVRPITGEESRGASSIPAVIGRTGPSVEPST